MAYKNQLGRRSRSSANHVIGEKYSTLYFLLDVEHVSIPSSLLSVLEVLRQTLLLEAVDKFVHITTVFSLVNDQTC